ncbi:MAG: hypothetical protein DRN53_07720 [Thermoprotei archaeon]|nr:MAG: hypothetical protein DRN53_07720 [Thermoprotei archaeon]
MVKRPLLASGTIVEDYEPLFMYWRVAEDRGIEKVVLKSEDFEYLKLIISREEKITLLELKNRLLSIMLERVNPDVAVEAYRRLSIELPPDVAKKMIAEVLVGWLIEAAETLNLIRLRKMYK